jgi:protein-L-isoaspartate(D-aspartate) O-methyltransferase
MTTATTGTPPDALRALMVDRIVKAGHARSAPVEQALRDVPRHLYVPAAPVEDAYADIAVITKRAGDGAALSCASAPTVVAMMLDQLDVRPGDRILEIGAGTGYNAALLARLTGPSGHVTTIDIDQEVTERARQALDATGYRDVQVITRDGALRAGEYAPYDRIIFTVGAWDLPSAFWNQLAPGGRLVVPLRWRGQTRSVAFVHQGGALRSDSLELCGFVPMLGQDGERTGHLDADDQVALYWDADQDVDLTALRGVLTKEKTECWSQVIVGGHDPFDGVWLRLTSDETGLSHNCRPGRRRGQALHAGDPVPEPCSCRGGLTGLPRPSSPRRGWSGTLLGARRDRPRPNRSAARRPPLQADPRMGPRPVRPARRGSLPSQCT